MGTPAIYMQMFSGREKLIPCFLPPKPPEDNFLATVALRRIEGMFLLETKSPGIIPAGAFDREFDTLKRYIIKETGAPEDSEEHAKAVYSRAAGTVVAILQDPDKPEHTREAEAAIAMAKQQGYGLSLPSDAPQLPPRNTRQKTT